MSHGDVALQGEMGSVTAVARNLSRLDGMNEAIRFVSAGIQHVQAAGNAKSLTSLLAACTPIQTHAQRIAAARTAVGSALSSYANEVSVLQQEARLLRAREETARARRGGLARALAETGADGSGDDAESMFQARKLHLLVEEVDAEINHIERALLEIDQARLQADRRCAESLDGQAAVLNALAGGASGGSGGTGAGAGVSLASLARIAHRATLPEDLDISIEAMASGTLTHEQVATVWENLGLTRQQVRDLPMKHLFTLANIDGVPAWARDIASRKALDYAISQPATAYGLMGFTGTDLSHDEFVEQIAALKASLKQATRDRFTLPGDPKVQMLGFGNHYGALTAAISFGDLDTASNVGVNVPGMGSNVGDMNGALGAAKNLFRTATGKNPRVGYAVVSWFGYRSPDQTPGYAGVLGMGRAHAGAPNLAGFLDGIRAFRSTDSSNALDRVVVLAHSYGSTTAAQALKRTAHDVDAFVTYGSAGLRAGTTREELHTHEMFATKAKGDQVAGMGYTGNDRVDPLEIGAEKFDSESGKNRVTAHSMFTEDTSPSFGNWGGEIGYLADDTSALDFIGGVIAGSNH